MDLFQKNLVKPQGIDMQKQQQLLEPSIALLSAELIDQIAAGEVVERPASILKELLENAFDAGAQEVVVRLEEGGLRSLMVTDDGHGMSEANARMAVLRHATSKIQTLNDFETLATCGFRGEALAAIASVSHLTLISRRKEAQHGIKLSYQGLHLQKQSFCACAVGTQIIVEDLFYNVPARKKFMRSPATEQAHCLEMAWKILLAAKTVGGVVFSNGRRILDLPASLSLEKRLELAFYGKADNWQRFSWKGLLRPHNKTCNLAIYHGRIPLQRNNHRLFYTFVNGRLVRDRLLNKAIAQSFQTYLNGAVPPAIVVYVTIDASEVDWNVHPQKLEIRFLHEAAVFEMVLQAMAELLGGPQSNTIPEALKVQQTATAAASEVTFSALPSKDKQPIAPEEGYKEAHKESDKEALVSQETLNRQSPTKPMQKTTSFYETNAMPKEDQLLWIIDQRFLLGRNHQGEVWVLDGPKAYRLWAEHCFAKISQAQQTQHLEKRWLPVSVDVSEDLDRCLQKSAGFFEKLVALGISLRLVGKGRLLLDALASHLEALSAQVFLVGLQTHWQKQQQLPSMLESWQLSLDAMGCPLLQPGPLSPNTQAMLAYLLKEEQQWGAYGFAFLNQQALQMLYEKSHP